MSVTSNRPVIFISYSHRDEPEHPRGDEVQWLSFILTYLRPAVNHGIVNLWVDLHILGGADWEEEIEQNLRTCDIFILLVSAYSMASEYVVDKEIAIIRKRQAQGDDVCFYPLLLTPTPDAGLDKVRDKNLRSRGAQPFSKFSYHDRCEHMTEAVNEIAKIAEQIAKRKDARAPITPSKPLGAVLVTETALPHHAARIAGLTEQFRTELAGETRLGNVSALIFDLLETIRELPDPSLWTSLQLDQLRNVQELLVDVFYIGDARADDGTIGFGTLAPLLQALSGLFAGTQMTGDCLVVVNNELAPYVDAIRIAIAGLAVVEMPNPARAEVETMGKYFQILEHRADKRIDLQRVEAMAARIRAYRIGALQRLERLIATLIGKRLDRAPRFAVFCDEFVGRSDGPELVIIPAGEFLMGFDASKAEFEREDRSYVNENLKDQGRHSTRIARRFALGRYLVTIEEYDAFLAATNAERKRAEDEADDRGWGRGRRPVINVCWADARDYCEWLNRLTGLTGESGYRLPSEAEWEYACRAGTQTQRWWGDAWDSSKANGSDHIAGKTSLVGRYAANPWGLYDMIGNVEEWCADHYCERISSLPYDGTAYHYQGSEKSERSYRVLRGGSWNDPQGLLRSSSRGRGEPDNRYNSVGFRVARTL